MAPAEMNNSLRVSEELKGNNSSRSSIKFGFNCLMFYSLVPRVSLLPVPWSEREMLQGTGRRETLGTRLDVLFYHKHRCVHG